MGKQIPLPDGAFKDIGGYSGALNGNGKRMLICDSLLQLIGELKASGLRGRGGAGFPSGLKYVSGVDAWYKEEYPNHVRVI